MTNSERPERRRGPRVNAGGRAFRLDVRTRVRLLDISLTGALVGSDVRIPVGSTGHLHTTFGGAPFEGEITVKRMAQAGAVGALFTAIDGQSRRRLEAFLQRANV